DAMTILARRGEDDLAIVRRPDRHTVFRRVVGELAGFAAAQIQHENIVVAAQRVAAVGGKSDAGAVMADGRLALIEHAAGDLPLAAAIRRDRPEVIAAIAIGKEDDVLAIRRPDRL